MSISGIDTSIFFLVNRGMQSSFLDAFMPLLSNNVKILFLLPAAWILLREKTRAIPVLIIALAALAIADSSGNLLKAFVGRTRPCFALENVHVLVGLGRSFSMPSNHSSNAFAIAVSFLLLGRDAAGAFSFALAALVALSRVYVGVHYPFDVAAGALLGAGAAYVSVQLYGLSGRLYKTRAYGRGLFLILLILSLFRIYYILTGPFDLSADEAHYWEWSRHLDWSYYSKGPLIAVLIHLGTALFGNNVFGVRIIAVLLSCLSSVLLYRLGREMYDEKTGFVAGLLVQAVPVYSIFGILFTIDSPFLFFWILSLYLFWKAIQAEGTGEGAKSSAGKNDRSLMYWLLLGVSVGFGLLAKYTMAFFYVSAFLFLMLDKDARRYLFRKTPYAAFLISIAVFSPVIFWNAKNGWITVRHTAGQAHVADGLKLSAATFFDFLGSQIGVLTPIVAVMTVVSLWKLRKERPGSLLFWFSMPMIVFFLIKSVQGKVQANWASAAYAAGFIALPAYYLRGVEGSKKKIKILFGSALVVAFAVTIAAHLVSIPGLAPDKNPSKKLLGWKELGAEVSAALYRLPPGKPTFVLSDSYQIASELAFYMKGQPAVYCLNIGRRMNQYDLWPGFEDFRGYNAVFVIAEDYGMPDPPGSAFSGFEKVPIAIRTKADGVVKFTLFKCYDFKGMKKVRAETY